MLTAPHMRGCLVFLYYPAFTRDDESIAFSMKRRFQFTAIFITALIAGAHGFSALAFTGGGSGQYAVQHETAPLATPQPQLSYAIFYIVCLIIAIGCLLLILSRQRKEFSKTRSERIAMVTGILTVGVAVLIFVIAFFNDPSPIREMSSQLPTIQSRDIYDGAVESHFNEAKRIAETKCNSKVDLVTVQDWIRRIEYGFKSEDPNINCEPGIYFTRTVYEKTNDYYMTGKGVLPDQQWNLSSTEAINTALEKGGADFFKKHSSASVFQMELRNLNGKTTWITHFRGDGLEFTCYIDAITGDASQCREWTPGSL